MDTGSFLGLKRPGFDTDHPPPSNAEVKKRVELYLYSPLGLRGLFYGELYLSPLPQKCMGLGSRGTYNF